MAKFAVLCLLFVASSLCSGKDEAEGDKSSDPETNDKSDKRDKRQALRDIFTLYGGWKPILPGSPYYFGSQPFSGGIGGFSYRNPGYGEMPSSTFLGYPSFYIPAATANLHRKNIFSYYPPPVIASNYGKDYFPKPLYTERRRRNRPKGQGNRLIPYDLGNIATIDIKNTEKDLEVLDLQLSLLPLGRGNLKHPIGQTNLQLSPVPIVPQIPKTRPFNTPRRPPQIKGENVPVILPAIPVHPKQLPPFQTINSFPHQLKHSDLVLTAHPLHTQVQEFYQPQPPLKSKNYQPQKQEELLVTVLSGDVDSIQKGPDVSKEEVKVVPIEIPDGALQPAAVVDEVIEIKDIPIDITANEKYASSNKRPSVQYLSLSRDQVDKIIKGSGIPVEAELIFSSAENRGYISPSRGANHGDTYKREEVITLNVKPGQSVEDALLQLATNSKDVRAESGKLPIHPSYETLEIVDVPGNDYLFSKRSEKSAIVVQRTTPQSQKSTTNTIRKPATPSP